MKRLAFLAILGLSTCVLATGLHTEVQIESTLTSLEQTWVNAAIQGDRATLDKLLDSSFIETMPNGARRSKADVLFAPALPPGAAQSLGNLKVRVLGNVAMVSGVNHYTPASGLKTIDYAFTDLYVRRGDTWRVASSHTTLGSVHNV
ncbi:nuclear transport factor 2 family protein [Paraburkholderia bryophila]|uniref:nuclear transport factor 2 family protein n=1 Tax=Paraburkholderia bryophila TaxID=420952 RepID=UPI002349CE8D|nr:nuclear transport factor 2 family protein [Paraburkholderia bryophila]WCM19295.1 nuclear transport factor 2 family protein [Paraburkholderia bryophila]